MNWQPITSAPKDGTVILGFHSTSGKSHPGDYFLVSFQDEHWANPEEEDDWYVEPMFWMPLPPPPEQT